MNSMLTVIQNYLLPKSIKAQPKQLKTHTHFLQIKVGLRFNNKLCVETMCPQNHTKQKHKSQSHAESSNTSYAV